MENTNQPIQQSAPQQIVFITKQKSVLVAFLLTFFFGPLGLLYASVIGGITLMVLGFIIGIMTLGIGLVFAWVASIIWAVVAVNMHNKKTGA